MKLTVGKRILMFIHWLLSLLICAALTLQIVRPDLLMRIYNAVTGKLNATQIMIIGITLLALYVIFVVIEACIIFGRGKRDDRGFITVDSSESGRVRIAVSAIEHMVRHSVTDIDGIDDMKIDIDNLDDAIGINVAAIIKNGCHVPTVTMNMQQAIRKFVEMNCGVAVRSVSVSVNAVNNNGRGRKAGADNTTKLSYNDPPFNNAPEAEPAAEVKPEPETPAPAEDAYAVEPGEPAETEEAPAFEAGAAAADDEASESEESFAADEAAEVGETADAEETVEASEADAAESCVIPDTPEPIRLHFDHIPEDAPAAADDADEEKPETALGEDAEPADDGLFDDFEVPDIAVATDENEEDDIPELLTDDEGL